MIPTIEKMKILKAMVVTEHAIRYLLKISDGALKLIFWNDLLH